VNVPASVIICTNRYGPWLIDALTSVAEQVTEATELILVRSGVDDEAPLPPLVSTWLAATGRPLRVIAEPHVGVAAARQTGLQRASADVVLFIDDDVIAQPGWYEAITAAMTPPDVGAAGGPIVPQWPNGHPPRWLHRRLRTYYGQRQARARRRLMPFGRGHMPFGANMAIRRCVALQLGGVRTDLGHRGATLGFHEDTELCRRIAESGHRVVEVAAAVVVHRLRPEQLRLRWVLQRAWFLGRSDARRDHARHPHRRPLRLLYLAALLAATPVGLLHRPTAVYLCARLVCNAGYLWESRG
jgi:GT2 family glycosyltransferase